MHPILTTLESHLEDRGDRLAVADPTLMLRYGELLPVARGLAGRIAESTNASAVGILAPTSAAAATAILACWYADKTPVPLNFMLAPEELRAIVADAGLDLILTVQKFAPALEPLGVRLLQLDGKTLVPGAAAAPRAADDDLAVMLYTSGTSGRPKGVRLSFGNIVSNCRAAIEHAQIEPNHVFLSILPQFHSFGFTAMTVVPLWLGATVHYLPRFSPVAVVETMLEREISVFMAVPSMYAALLGMKNAPRAAFAKLDLAITGGEPMPERVAAGLRERFGLELQEGYGLTETSPIVSINTPRATRAGSVGAPLPGTEVFAVDAAEQRLPAGETGELIIRGPGVMQGYHNQPAATAAALRPDGGLRTGDVGHVDADGFIFITGRAKEMLIVAGENVFPREIENVLLEHPAIAEAAVIGVRDDVRGELPVAYVILKPEQTATPTEIRAFCRERLAGYKAPREVLIAEDLPRGPTGKILKRALGGGSGKVEGER